MQTPIHFLIHLLAIPCLYHKVYLPCLPPSLHPSAAHVLLSVQFHLIPSVFTLIHTDHQTSQACGLQSKNGIRDSVFSLRNQGITNERKRKLEQQLQSIMVLNRQFEHVQNFINWAVCSKTSIPFLFSKELVRTPTPQSLTLG